MCWSRSLFIWLRLHNRKYKIWIVLGWEAFINGDYCLLLLLFDVRACVNSSLRFDTQRIAEKRWREVEKRCEMIMAGICESLSDTLTIVLIVADFSAQLSIRLVNAYPTQTICHVVSLLQCCIYACEAINSIHFPSSIYFLFTLSKSIER